MTTGNPAWLAHWRRTVAELYQAVRKAAPSEQPRAWELFCTARDDLFRSHPQTPLSAGQRTRFSSLNYYPYHPDWRMSGVLDTDVKRETFSIELAAEGLLRYIRVAHVSFSTPGGPGRLSLFWIEGYGGGLFLPFRDATSGRQTYGGGRYLYDTIKGADLGVDGEKIVLDFNYAYNPSCAYNSQWVCPLAPPENAMPFPVEAGEKEFRI